MNRISKTVVCFLLALLIAQSYAATTEATGQKRPVSTAKPNYVIFDCQQVENAVDSDPTSADRSLDPAGLVRIMFGTKTDPISDQDISVQIFHKPNHGKLRTEIAKTGYKFFAYDPAPGYLGKDQVVFLVTIGNKIYKVVSTLQAVKISDEREDQTRCPAPQSLKVAWKGK